MGARYPYYLLADSRDGQTKEAEVTRTVPSSQPVRGNIRHGFVYERVPHITLKSIANNAEIDVIWDQWQAKLEPLRETLNAALKKTWQEWEIPREADAKWPDAAKKLHADWWHARIARQQEIDKSIAAKAEFEYLYDKPYDDKKYEKYTDFMDITNESEFETRFPPMLRTQGVKTQTEWFFKFLKAPYPIRPTLQPIYPGAKALPDSNLRMPTFDFSDEAANSIVRWFAVRETRVVESDDEPNYRWDTAIGLVPIGEGR
jgi:hypothetical protein